MTDSKRLDTVQVDKIDENTLYTAKIVFKSMGDSPGVFPDSEWSHEFPDDINEDDLPAAFIAAKTFIINFNRLAMAASQQYMSDTEEQEEDEDDRLDLIAEAADEPTLH